MRKQKAIIFALIGVFAVSAATVGAVLGSSNILNNRVNATTTSTCTLNFTSRQQATIGPDGTGVGLAENGTVTTVYSKAATAKGKHVRLLDGGVMKNSGDIYDAQTERGGLIHSIKSITVNYKTDGIKIDDVYDPGYEFGSPANKQINVTSLNLNYGKNSNKTVVSGEKITFDQVNYLPESFILSAKVTSDYDTPEDCYVDIESVIIECDHLVDRYFVDYDETQTEVDPDMKLGKLVGMDKQNVTGANYSLENHNYETGDVAVLIANNEEFISNDKTVVVTGATKVEYGKIGNKTATYITIGSEDVKAVVKQSKHKDPYQGRAFVGDYTMMDFGTYFGAKEKTLTVGQDGIIKYGDSNLDYTADDNDNITIVTQPSATEERKIEFAKVRDNLVVYKNLGTSATNPQHTYLYGMKGAEKDVTITTHARLEDHVDNYVVTLQSGTQTETVLSYYNTTVVDKLNGVSITADTGDFSTAKTFTLTETHLTGEHFAIDDSIAKDYAVTEVDGKQTTKFVVFRNGKIETNSKNGGISTIQIGAERGTYKIDEATNIVLDGCGTYTIGQETGTYTFDSKKNLLIAGENTYTLDLTKKTATKVVLINGDQWAVKKGEYVYDKFALTLNAGKATLTPKGDFASLTEIPYTVKNSVLTFTAEWTDNDYESDTFMETFKSVFTFDISEDLKELTLVNKVETGSGYGATTFLAAGSKFVDKSLVVDPWETKTASYENNGLKITFLKGKALIEGNHELLDGGKGSYTYANGIAKCKFAMNDDESPWGADTFVEFRVDLDNNTITAITPLSQAPYGSPLIAEGTVFTLVK